MSFEFPDTSSLAFSFQLGLYPSHYLLEYMERAKEVLPRSQFITAECGLATVLTLKNYSLRFYLPKLFSSCVQALPPFRTVDRLQKNWEGRSFSNFHSMEECHLIIFGQFERPRLWSVFHFIPCIFLSHAVVPLDSTILKRRETCIRLVTNDAMGCWHECVRVVWVLSSHPAASSLQTPRGVTSPANCTFSFAEPLFWLPL
ncbi:hypothetical protein BJ878DRAFT_562831 [Calycina marina]|uniref:Uncharacterized protein n=1 Tax=Calycina marina TaxID=1763456 RepID=A0A9P8CGH1_9HELO|nr:hypothetical protein BJ878DRAFT_562831 [Calycina marina]